MTNCNPAKVLLGDHFAPGYLQKVVAAALLMCTAPQLALSACEAGGPGCPIPMPGVTVIGASLGRGGGSPFANYLFMSVQTFNVHPAVLMAQHASVYVEYENWLGYQEILAEAPKLSSRTNDVRCSILATPATRETTSFSSSTDRYVAAQQLFSALMAQEGAIGAKSAVSSAPVYLDPVDGIKKPTFPIIYIDGGKERFIVLPTRPMTLLIEGNMPGSLQLGSNTQESCTTAMIG